MVANSAGDSKVEVIDTGSGYIDFDIDGELQVQMFDGLIEVITGTTWRVMTTTDGHTFVIQVYDTNGTTWRDALTFENGDSSDSSATNYPRIHLGSNVAFTGLGNMAVGMIWGSDISTNTELTYTGVNQLYMVTACGYGHAARCGDSLRRCSIR
jgi:L-cysteine desulfidase